MSTWKLLAISAVSVLAACANTTPVQPAAASKSEFDGAVYSGQVAALETPVAGVEQYRVFEQGATGFVSVQNVREGVQEIAAEFCGRKAKAMRGVSETFSNPPHILGNFPRVELVFQCVDRPAASAAASGGSAISAATGAPAVVPAINKYQQIEALMRLLDSGALTQAEFESEKAKVLAGH